LLGRNHPVGIALGALLWGFLERGTGKLEFEGRQLDSLVAGIVRPVPHNGSRIEEAGSAASS
ncbi:hypothetical protein ABZ954_27000, partial [Streptomyces sp. NPDC046631]